LILIASPHAVRSHFVNGEIRLFKSRHPHRAMIPVIVEASLRSRKSPPA